MSHKFIDRGARVWATDRIPLVVTTVTGTTRTYTSLRVDGRLKDLEGGRADAHDGFFWVAIDDGRGFATRLEAQKACLAWFALAEEQRTLFPKVTP